MALRERTVRFLYDIKDQKETVIEEYQKFVQESKAKQVELFVTANVVLSDQNKKSFVVFYGQTYDDDYKHVLPPGVIRVKKSTDIGEKVPKYKDTDVSKIFDKIYKDKSGLTCVKVINLVYVLRTLI